MSPLSTLTALAAWQNFYVIVGTAAGALTGLTFVAITLVVQLLRRNQDAENGIGAFTTPTAADFGTVLFICALLSVPWSGFVPPAVLLALCGLAGVLYTTIVVRRLRRLETYAPVLEDLLWYGACPLVAYAALFVAALFLPGSPTATLFVLGGVMLLLLFLGIRNALDVVTYLAVERFKELDERSEKDEKKV